MIRCPICHKGLDPFKESPYAPICSEACRKVALRRAGVSPEEGGSGEESGEATDQFEELTATALYCRNCKQAMPTKQRLLLNLPSGDLYGYTCAQCGADLGTKTDVQGS